MKTAISVDLGGASYQLDQDAFLALHAYLARAADRLVEHPDRDEVLAGLERSIGAKLARGGERSGPIGAAEMAAALKEVGKVDGPRLGPEPAATQADFEPDRGGTRPDFDAHREAHPRMDFDPDSHVYADYSAGPRPRHLYRIGEGKMIAGVCTGLAAYLGLDVGLTRAIAVIAAVFTGGFVIIAAYVVLMFLVPLARTSTEVAAAHGALRSV